MVYALFDDAGFILEFYDDVSHPPVVEGGEIIRRNDAIPAIAVEVTEAQRAAIVGAPQFHRWSGAGLVMLPIPEPTPVLPNLSDRQFGEGLWRDGLISYEHYLAFVGPGAIPPALAAIIDTLPDDDTGGPTPRKVARGLVTGAKSYEFSNPLVDTIRQAQGWTDAQLRDHWTRWAVL